MHTHTPPPTSYCTSVPFSHCFRLLSPPAQVQTSHAEPREGITNVIILKGAGLDCTPLHLSSEGGAQISLPTSLYYWSIERWIVSVYVCSHGYIKDEYGWLHVKCLIHSMMCRLMSAQQKLSHYNSMHTDE